MGNTALRIIPEATDLATTRGANWDAVEGAAPIAIWSLPSSLMETVASETPSGSSPDP